MRLSSKKIIAPLSIGKKFKNRRKKIVFTNGCFDILHVGHLSYLERAKKLGDLLIVALNSDASIKRIKGSARPINTLKDRMRLLAGLECVDAVTYFKEDDPLKLILRIKPHVLVKGGDWKISEIIGAKEVQSWGGKVKSLNFVAGHSTSNVIKKIKPTFS